MMRCHDGRVINIKDSENITYTIENIACDDWTIADNCGTKEKFRTDELTIMARKDNKLNMKSIFINDCEYGLRRLKTKSRKIKKKTRKFRTNRIIIFIWCRRLGKNKRSDIYL